MPAHTAYRFRSGDMCIHGGRYSYDGYVDAGGRPMPKLSEMTAQLRGGERFPRIGKHDSPCWWVLLEADDPAVQNGAHPVVDAPLDGEG